jgi:DNA-binding transcriptional MerR regulator
LQSEVRDQQSGGASLRSGELAARAGVSKDTLRFYERRRLLPVPRRLANGYRLYPREALARVLLIRVALSIGFSISELAGILRVRDSGGSPCRDVRRLAGEKLDRLALSILRSDLETVIADWDRRLARTASGRRAGLLEALADRRAGAAEASFPHAKALSHWPWGGVL